MMDGTSQASAICCTGTIQRWRIDMLTGRRIREARDKLGGLPSELARRANLALSIVRRAEATDGEAVVTTAQIASLRLAFTKVGVDIAPEDRLLIRDKE